MDSASIAQPPVWLIVLNWNGARLLREHLPSLGRLRYPSLRVLVVDNGSADDSLAAAKEALPSCELLPLGQNLGFAAGNNAGMRHALAHGAELIGLLNNDLSVEPDWLSKLVEARARHPRAGILGGTVLFQGRPDRVNSTGLCIDRFWRVRDRDFDAPRQSAAQAEEPVDGVTGGAMLLSAEALRRAGLFDPTYFAYYEDADLCLRVRKAGMECVFVPESIAHHRFAGTLGESSPRRRYLLGRNHLLFCARHAPAWKAALLLPVTALYRLAIKAPRELARGNGALALAELKAAASGCALGAAALARRLTGQVGHIPKGAEPA